MEKDRKEMSGLTGQDKLPVGPETSGPDQAMPDNAQQTCLSPDDLKAINMLIDLGLTNISARRDPDGTLEITGNSIPKEDTGKTTSTDDL